MSRGAPRPGPAWVREDVVRAIHRSQLAIHGGGEGIRDEGLLSAALAKPKQIQAYEDPAPDLARLAAAYAAGIARSHPFVDGNKRTAYVTCRAFLLLNGFDLVATKEEKFQTFFNLASRALSEENLADWIREHLTETAADG